jgi:hypothetical protein
LLALAFLNELLPTDSDFREWKKETDEGVTDIPLNPEWKKASDVPDAIKLQRAIHVTGVTPTSKTTALHEFDKIVRQIEICRGDEASGISLLNSWPANPDDKSMCDACDSRTFCPGFLAKNHNNKPITPAIPSI